MLLKSNFLAKEKSHSTSGFSVRGTKNFVEEENFEETDVELYHELF